ncbi:MAG: response regulator [Bacteroidales bacterium]|nr:response regulator [Bacteroidales bacterium]
MESELGKGSTFKFKIPYSPDKTASNGDGTNNMAPKVDWDNKKILIAEDEDINYFYLHEMMKKTGASLLRAKNGLEAVQMAANVTVDLILMDIKMPEMNGLEATRAIKQKTPWIPIVAVTAYAMGNDRQLCLDAGCDDYLAKPLRKTELFAIIDKFLKKA